MSYVWENSNFARPHKYDDYIDWLNASDRTAYLTAKEATMSADDFVLWKEDLVKQCQWKRFEEYPNIEEQMEMQFNDKVNSTTTWDDAINTVRNNNPKPVFGE
tara:strand:+ start:525 stop:833 length:309 start_codon:yes stop_codon:yes gene_type:complete